MKSLSCVQLPATPWTTAHQAPLSMGFPMLEYCHFHLQGTFLTQGWNPGLLHWQVDSLPTELQGREAQKRGSICMLLLSCFSRVRLCGPQRRQPTRLPRPWDSPGKNTGVGCHFLLQHMKVKSESEVAQLCPTLRDPMDCSLPGSSAQGIFQARVLE